MTLGTTLIDKRLESLENHLARENPVLLSTVQSFRTLDRVAYRMGLMDRSDSYATHIPWWPLVSILGTFSSGKSTFINHFLGYKLQRTGNQAVDDKFTVICFTQEDKAQSLPGVALDSDPRFPFYQISDEIELVSKGEGRRIDAYLQLRTCPSEQLRGKILIDSPGFDADAQRTATLRITNHIVDLSDLVLVFFDARHPEPGAMQDTLNHLVTETIHRSDSSKFLYILNQIDTTAREDNPEEVVGAWERALGERGLTAGRFYTIYNPDAAVPIDDEARRARYESKRDTDLAEIHERMKQVETERAYRIVGSLEKTAQDIEEKVVPLLNESIRRWRKRVIWTDILGGAAIVAILVALSLKLGLSSEPEGWWASLTSNAAYAYIAAAGVVILVLAFHFSVRKLAAKSLLPWLRRRASDLKVRGDLGRAFLVNTRPWRSIFSTAPAGWNRSNKNRLKTIHADTDSYIQKLNDRFTNPSGGQGASATGDSA